MLIRPVGGRWKPRYDFEGIVVAHHPEIRAELFPAAFAAGQRVLEAGTTTPNRTDYHRAMLRVLGVDASSAALLGELEAPAAGPVVEVFPDAQRVLEQLRASGVGMSVVSDTWAGLEDDLLPITVGLRNIRAIGDSARRCPGRSGGWTGRTACPR